MKRVDVTFEEAHQMIDIVIGLATMRLHDAHNRDPIAVAVVDEEGRAIISSARNADETVIRLAARRAMTAAVTGADTRRKSRVLQRGADRCTDLELSPGGATIKWHGTTLGGIGVAGRGGADQQLACEGRRHFFHLRTGRQPKGGR